jgi:hypothetical protein
MDVGSKKQGSKRRQQQAAAATSPLAMPLEVGRGCWPSRARSSHHDPKNKTKVQYRHFS